MCVKRPERGADHTSIYICSEMYTHSPDCLHGAAIKHIYSLSSTNFGYGWEICGSWARELTCSEIIVANTINVNKKTGHVFKLPP